jgi:hypothetical protein
VALTQPTDPGIVAAPTQRRVTPLRRYLRRTRHREVLLSAAMPFGLDAVGSQRTHEPATGYHDLPESDGAEHHEGNYKDKKPAPREISHRKETGADTNDSQGKCSIA